MATRSRSRRLEAGEDGLLLAACGSHLRAVVEAALEAGMRLGEILSLQWSEVEGLTVDGSKLTWAPRAELVLPWTKTKTRRGWRIPISTRLRALLGLRRLDPAGQPLPSTAYVFGNDLGQRVTCVKRAWMTAVLKSHGVKPTLTNKANFTPDARAALERIDLHFRDLRREAGSRWLEGGVPLHTIRDWLGHTNIAQTSMYLAGTVMTQHDAMRVFEERRAASKMRARINRAGNGRKTGRYRDQKPDWVGANRSA